MARIGVVFLMAGVICVFCSCDHTDSTKPEDIGIIIPPLATPICHSYPCWFGSQKILLENLGATKLYVGGADVQEEGVGVIEYNLADGLFTMLVPYGERPSTSYDGQVFCCIFGSRIVVGDQSSWAILDEENTWTSRSCVTVSPDGEQLAWAGYGDTFQYGVWVYSIQTREYNFIVRGDYPTWSPQGGSLLVRVTHGVPTAHLIEFHLASGTSDTLYTFPEDQGVDYSSYSLDGNQIAFNGLSLNNSEKGLYILTLDSGQVRKISNMFGLGLDWGEGGVVFSNASGSLADTSSGVLWITQPPFDEFEPLTERFQFVF